MEMLPFVRPPAKGPPNASFAPIDSQLPSKQTKDLRISDKIRPDRIGLCKRPFPV